MELELFKKIIDDCGRCGIRIIQLFNFGEPLIHPELPEMVRYTKAHAGGRVQISTNAALLSEEKAQALLEAGIDRINIDIDGYTRETYEGVRRKLSFDQVVNNTKNLLKLRRKSGKRLFISISIIRMKETEGELKAFRKYWKPLADRVLEVEYNVWLKKVGTKSGLTNGAGSFTCPCKFLWDQLVVLHDGRVPLCCLDYDGQVVVGNMLNETIPQIWNGARLNKIRHFHTNMEMGKIPTCAACNQYIYMEGSQWQYMWGGGLKQSAS